MLKRIGVSMELRDMEMGEMKGKTEKKEGAGEAAEARGTCMPGCR